ncbi:MAG TPA: TIGR04222 domain-containing membrane protein [Blastocatellia bacterium]|jgi:uncharacterized protein (TIGR04222 family)|nr:TIGR04222 domain-containing membrane protein [Blastocatellia bacterium]
MKLLFLPNPFELRGPEFLALYVIVLAVAVAACLLIRRMMNGPGGDAPPLAARLDPYEVAYLAGGANLATDTALATLVQRGQLAVDTAQRRVIARSELPPSAHHFERTVYSNTSRQGISIDAIRTNSSHGVESLAARLKAHGLVLSDEQARQLRLLSACLMMIVTLFGVIKILVGVARGRPVGFLFFLCAISGFVALYFYKSRPHRTRLGDRLLDSLKLENAALEYTARKKPSGLMGADLAMAIGLFGISTLAIPDGPLRELRTALAPPPSASSGSSCSGGSCSSGSSCGGGCGGGCGGCGS